MEQRLKTLEDLCSMITKEVVEQNKNMMDMNKNLLNEIRCLRESFVKQDDYFDEFKTLLRKLFELNKQNAALANFPASMMAALPTHSAGPNVGSGGMLPSFIQQVQSQQPTPTNATISSASVMNNSYLNDFTNQSMFNNVSYQSERTPLNTSSLPPTFANNNLNLTASSIPSSASALQKQQQQQQQQNLFKQSIANQQQQIPKPLFPPNLSQPPPTQPVSSVSLQNIKNNSLPQPQIPVSVSESNIKFLPSNTTSTPQAASTNSQFNLFKPQQNVNQSSNNNNKPPPFQLSPSKPVATQNLDQQKPASIFGSNLFKTTTITQPELAAKSTTTSVFSATTANLFKAPEPTKLEDHEDLAGAEGNPEEYEPQCDFKPIVHLKEVEVKTGEEDEDILFAQRCKLYRFVSETKEWKEKGVGELKLLKHKQTSVIRLLMRRDQVLKLCANHRISPDLKLNRLSDKNFSWMACDFSEPTDTNGRNEIFLVKFKLSEEASKFKQEFEKAVLASKNLPPSTQSKSNAVGQTTTTTSNQPSLSEQFKNENWKCNACYAPNKKDDIKCACCQTPKPGHESSATNTQGAPGLFKFPSSNTSPAINLLSKSSNEPPKSQSTFSFGVQPNSTNNITPNKPLFSFGSQQTQQQQQQPTTNTPPKFGFSPFNPNQQQQQQQITTVTSLLGTSNNTGSMFGKPLFGSGNTSNDVSSIFKSTPSAPGGFSGGLQPITQSAKPLFGAATTKNEEEGDEDGGENQNPEEYEPQVDFKPIVKLNEVDVKTGEEDEDVVFKQRGKLYRFIGGEWKEKGTGEMKILRHKKHNYMFRILMRRDQVLKLCANHRITPELKFEIYNEKQVRWHAQDYSEGEGKHETLAIRFKSEEDAKKFKAECENAQKLFSSSDHSAQPSKPQSTTEDNSKPSLSQIFKKENTWTCNGCYVNNKQESTKCAACGTAAPGNAGQTTEVQAPKPINENKIPFGLSTGKTTTGPISFGSSAFGKTNDETNKATIDSVFGVKSGPSFADLAKQSQPSGFGGGFKSLGAQPLFGAGSQPKPLFGAAITTNNEDEGGEDGGDNQNPEEYEPQVDFKPLVKLSEVEVKTGEEDEEVLFKQRCKLYRFVTEAKEWKEKGTGEIKILKHKQKEHSYRILMRRDQVLKICANHRITSDLKLEIINEKQVRYLCNDCSENEPCPELLTIRFRSEEDAKNFKSQVESIQQYVSQATPIKNTTTDKNINNNNNIKSNGLASLVKQGTWSCASCLSSNKPEAEKCAACETPKPNATTNKNDDDIQITGSVSANNEQIKEARKYGLPDNFYLYENKAPCPGCRGCESES